MHHKVVLVTVLAAIFTLGLFFHGHRGPEPLMPRPIHLPITPPHPIAPNAPVQRF